MTKSELQIIADAVVVATKYPKIELTFAYIDFDEMCICATNTRKLIKYHLRADEVEMCTGVHFLHRSILKAIISICDNKDTEYKFVKNNIVIGNLKIKVGNVDANESEYKYPALEVLKARYEHSYTTDTINYIDFDLTHRNTHINSDMFKMLQEHCDVSKYQIESIAQTKDTIGSVQITGIKNNQKRLTAVMIGVEYKPQAPTLFDMQE
jgi:hypothetical protein